MQLFDYHNSQVKEQVGTHYRAGTHKHYVVARNKLAEFLKHTYKADDFPLENLSHKFVTDFEFYLKTEQELSSNTAMKKIKQLKKIVNIALDNEWIVKNPLVSGRFF
ncbi:MAG: phage integrase SAM-like domain-containing protein [Chitinophagaceae bacterium]|nr:phage integrase SAM-like domain-containing protein [Chitinophagaceae bacterium]